MSYKPEGYPSLSPYLIVEDAQAILDFAEAVFGGTTLRVIRDGDRIVHAETRIAGGVVMMGEMPGGAAEAHLHLYLPDPDAAHARAMDCGADCVQEMAEQGDGERRGGVRGPGNVTWWLARQV